LILKAFKNW